MKAPKGIRVATPALVIAVAVALGGCSRSQPPSPPVATNESPAQPMAAPAPAADASASFADLVRLVKSGIDQSVLLAYINAAATPYQLGADQIAYLADLGVAPEVLRKLGATTEQAGQADAPPASAETSAAPVIEQAASPPPSAAAPTADLMPAGPVAEPEPQVVPTVEETVMEPPEVAAPPAAAVNISFFYEALAPYGNWLQVDGAQYWQPAAVGLDTDWQPYCQHGHWVNSNCGWAWYSDYSWGWAPFHYGRWRHDDRLGWIWAPDTVWGPAWVNWREHAGVIGWAPLPPGAVYVPGVGFTFHGRQVAVGFEFGLQAQQYTFVEMRYFCELRLAQRMLPRTQVAQYYANTTIIQNNYTYINNVIVNRGPAIALITEATHREIPWARIVDQDLRPGQPIRGNVLHAGQLALYRPRVAPTAPETPSAVVARHNAETAKREEARSSSVFNPGEGGSPARQESVRGRDSLAAIQSAGGLGSPAVHLSPAPQTAAGQAQVQSSAAGSLREEQRAAQASQQQAAERLRQEEAAGRQRAQQEAAAQQEAQRLRTQQEEATRQRVQQEAEQLRKRAESAENLRQQQEAERLRQAEAQARQQQQETAQREREAQLRAQQEAQRQQEEQRQAREAADRLRAEEEAAARVRAQEAADRQRAQQEAAERQREEQRQAQQEAAQREQQLRAQQEEAARATAASERGAASRSGR